MRKRLFIFLFGVSSSITVLAQQTLIKGSVKDGVTFEPLADVSITIEESQQTTTTDDLGEFMFLENVPLGEQVLSIYKLGYVTKRYPIVVNLGKTVNITDMTLDIDVSNTSDWFTIALSDDELNDDTGGADNISGLLSSSQDVFQRTVAFEFSSSFFNVRGLDSDNGTVLINGIEMNKLYNGRPQWSNWGGLNDVVRNQELASGLAPSHYNFGGILGTTNINTRASAYKKGGQLTYSSSDRSYTNRLMARYASGLMEGNWAFTLMMGRRWGTEGYQDATLYDSNSFFTSVEKKINDKHSINFTGIYAPNRRGKSSANTQEVYDLKGIRYNEYWGWQEGDKRNSRIKEVIEPILMLNYYWDISSKTSLNTNIAYQFGTAGNSRLDYNGQRLNEDGIPVGGGSNPSPSYYQKLPSFWLTPAAGPNYEQAYLNEQDFLNDGQIDWNSLYQTNLENADNYSTYILYEDRNDDKQITANTIVTSYLTDHTTLNGNINYSTLKSENFAEIIDLLGGNGYLNVDSFDGFQFDMQDPNRMALEGDRFRYNYNLYADVLSGFAQAQFKYNKVDFYLSASATNTQYQREGLYQNGAYPNNSLGKGEKLTFNGFGSKGGFTYKITGKHLVDINVGYITRAPSLRNTFSNSRENQNIVSDITEEKISTADISYIFRSPIVKAKLTGYYAKIEDANEISFFYADGIGGDNTAFVQEILQGIDKKHFGVELGIEAQVTPTIKLKGVAALGQYTYDNNPNLYLTSSDFETGRQDFGKASLKDYKLAGGPQTALSAGFEYRDLDFWWVGATANFFDHTYVDISPLTRTKNFYQDSDGLPFNDYDETIARHLLKQERFDNYMTVNLVGGKSWKLSDYYLGFFASVNNVLDEVYKTGGFEQGRNANYRQLNDDNSNDIPLFGSKYWYGRGITYFLNMYVRF
ncbi:carboxypeptidase regulatory-like domain-containing protein [Flavobacteriaceae bacterium LMO-SS05]